MNLLTTLYIALLMAEMVTFLMSIYHAYYAFRGIKGDRYNISILLAPFSILQSTNFDEAGNYHRIRFGRYLLVSLCIAGIVVLLQSQLDGARDNLTNQSKSPTQSVGLDRT